MLPIQTFSGVVASNRGTLHSNKAGGLVIQTQYGFGRFGVVACLTGVVLLGSTGLAAAQRRSIDSLVFASQEVGGSRIGLTIDEVADNDGAEEGAVVLEVRRESPASSAGFAAGDIIVEFDGERVRSARQLTRLVRETTVVRNERRVELEVTPEPGAAVMTALPALENLGERGSRPRWGAPSTSTSGPDLGQPGLVSTCKSFQRSSPTTSGSMTECWSPASTRSRRRPKRVCRQAMSSPRWTAETSTTSTTSAAVSRRSTRAKRCRSATRGGRELELAVTISRNRSRRRLDILRNDGRAL